MAVHTETETSKRLWAALTVVLILVLLLFGVCIGIHFAQRKLSDKVDMVQEQTLLNQQAEVKNRAVTCRLLIANGMHLDPAGPCLQAETLQYYDPNAVAPAATLENQAKQMEVLCQLLRHDEGTSLNCPNK